MTIELTIHDLCFIQEALEVHVKNEEYRPEAVQATYEKMRYAFETAVEPHNDYKITLDFVKE